MIEYERVRFEANVAVKSRDFFMYKMLSIRGLDMKRLKLQCCFTRSRIYKL
jgi:hypothetical protein